MELSQILIKPNTSILDTLKVIDNAAVEIALVVEGEKNNYEANINSPDYDKIRSDYADLSPQYNELMNSKNNNAIIRNNKKSRSNKEKNEIESTGDSFKSDYKFLISHKLKR